MIKNILAVAVVVALSACSGGSDDDDNVTTDTTPPATGTGTDTPATTGTPATTDGTPAATDAPTGGGAGAVDGTVAGSYLGSFGGGEGVYIIDNDSELAGLAIFADGSAQSLFGSVGTGDTFNGELQQFLHETSEVDPGVQSFASVAGIADNLAIDVTIINGQSITNTADSPTAVSLLAAVDGDALAPATAATLAGSWESINTFGGSGELTLATSMTFTGNSVTGSTTVANLVDGTSFDPVAIVGGITEFGDAAIIEFTWGTVAGYKGIVFFNPNGDGRVVFVGQNPNADDVNTDPPTISAVMTRVP